MNSRRGDAGQAIRERRERLNLTQAEVVAALQNRGADISLSTYQRIEYGQSTKPFADPKLVAALAKVLRWNPEDLLAVLGHIQSRVVSIDTRTQRMLEVFGQFDSDTAEAAEDILRVLLEKQQRERNKG